MPANKSTTARPLPYGVADYFWNEAALRKELEFDLYELFQRWGYEIVIPPTFEYADTFYARSNEDFQHEMYRFPDKDGTLLALRPDMTIPVARLVGTRLHDWPMPQRFCYLGSVFRYIEPRAGRQREFFQAGVELIGAGGPAGDAEVVALIASAAQTAQIHDYRLILGQIEYFNGLLHDLSLPPDKVEALQAAIDRNSEPQLSEFLTHTPLRTQQRRTLEALPDLRGANPFAVIAQAERHCLNHRMYASLANLRDICRALEGYGILDRLYLDLTEINNLGYYTGLSFELLAPQTGFTLGSGGRYDDLLASFGHNQPAVGAALGIDRLIHARQLQAQGHIPRRAARPRILVSTNDDPASLPYVQQWRAQGLHVTVTLHSKMEKGATAKDAPKKDRTEQDRMEKDSTGQIAPHTTDADYLLQWEGDGFRVQSRNGSLQTDFFAAGETRDLRDFLGAANVLPQTGGEQ